MQTFGAAPHHDILGLLIQMAVLLFVARALAEVAQRFNQPAVIGEILAGIILGPSLLSGFFPFVSTWVVPHTQAQGYLLEVVGLLGALFLLLLTGLETDLALIRRHARVSIGASIGGIVLPFATGYWLGQSLPDYMLADPDKRLVFSLFVATAMSISAIPVIAKVLMDMNLMRRDIGQAIIAAGMTDDAIGWMLLSIVLGLAQSGVVEAGSVLSAVGKVVGFMAFSFVVGRWLVRRALDFVQDKTTSQFRILSLVMVLTFAWGALTQGLELEAVFGAFVMGILLGQLPRLPVSVRHDLERIGLGVFAPIFFAVAGLKVNARALMEPRLLVIALVVIAVASLGKIVGGYIGARYVGGSGHWEAVAFGAGMNARGAMEIIIATIGLSLGILSPDMFSVIVVMAMATSLMAPPLLRWALKHIVPSEAELLRLRREELAEHSLVAGVRRVLIPVRCRAEERRAILTLETQLVEQLRLSNAVAVTLFTVVRRKDRGDAEAFLAGLAPRFAGVELTRKVVRTENAVAAILQEAQKDYDLMMVGASENGGDPEDLFTSQIDELLRMAPCPVMVVKGRLGKHNWPPRKILVPTNGSIAARNAADLAFAVADGAETEVLVLNVVEEEATATLRVDHDGLGRRRQLAAARNIVDELCNLGTVQGVRTRTRVEVSSDPEGVIVGLADGDGVDLVVLGTGVRAASERLFLGPRVERILNSVHCPLVLINAG